MGYNFTMNFCGGVIEDLEKMGGVEGVEKDVWRNVSAYYTQEGKVYSIGWVFPLEVLVRSRWLADVRTASRTCIR